MTTGDFGPPTSTGRDPAPDPDRFRFHGLHPLLRIGTASDRYAGWIGQIYTAERYVGRITTRTHKVGGKAYREQVLPVDSVREYFDCFQVLEIDFTFYGLLLSEHGKETSTYAALRSYSSHLPPEARLFLKVPQLIFARKIRQPDGFAPNPDYLDHRLFEEAFYGPAGALLGDRLAGLIFEQEYQRRSERLPTEAFAESLDGFFSRIPADPRYHVELRTESYLCSSVFSVLERHGIGQVFSRWTWLPPLPRQLERAAGRFRGGDGQCVTRLMTPIGMRYEDAYAKAHPFDRMSDELFQPALIQETLHLVQAGIQRGVTMNILINNRAGGSAPLIARMLAHGFLERQRAGGPPTVGGRSTI